MGSRLAQLELPAQLGQGEVTIGMGAEELDHIDDALGR